MTEKDRNEQLVEIVKAAVLRRLPMKHGLVFQDENGTIRYPAVWAEDIARNAVQAMQGVIGPVCKGCGRPLHEWCVECSPQDPIPCWEKYHCSMAPGASKEAEEE